MLMLHAIVLYTCIPNCFHIILVSGVLLPCVPLAADLEPAEISSKDPIHKPVIRRVRHPCCSARIRNIPVERNEDPARKRSGRSRDATKATTYLLRLLRVFVKYADRQRSHAMRPVSFVLTRSVFERS